MTTTVTSTITTAMTKTATSAICTHLVVDEGPLRSYDFSDEEPDWPRLPDLEAVVHQVSKLAGVEDLRRVFSASGSTESCVTDTRRVKIAEQPFAGGGEGEGLAACVCLDRL